LDGGDDLVEVFLGQVLSALRGSGRVTTKELGNAGEDATDCNAGAGTGEEGLEESSSTCPSGELGVSTLGEGLQWAGSSGIGCDNTVTSKLAWVYLDVR
jgi:hypothetical protein